MKNYNKRLCSIPCRLVCVLALVFFQNTLLADNSEIRPFSARYDVFRNHQHVGFAHFKLNKHNGMWTWNMKTRPKGFYKWLTRKKPFAETRMTESPDGLLLSQELKGDYKNKPAKEKTWFDQDKKIIYYTNGEKKRELDLPAPVYNFQSIHLLPATMKQDGLERIEINFYKRGKLFKSTLQLEADVKIQQDDSELRVDKVTQVLDGSDYKMIYYYQGDTLAPLKIEQLKDDGNNIVMWRNKLD